MHPIPETKRFILRPLEMKDVDEMFLMDSNPKVHLYLGNKPVQTKEEIEKVIAFVQQQYVDYGIGRYAVIDKQSHAFMGWCGLKYVDLEICGRKDYFDLGYRFLEEHWGKGIASETAEAWVQYAFNEMKIKELWGMADVDNGASNRILQKVGLRFVNQGIYDEVNHNCYRRTADEFQQSSLQ